MKMMTYKQLGGACDLEFRAETFEEISSLSQAHGAEMHRQQEPAHLEVMSKMSELMKKPEKMRAWFESKRQEFEARPDV